MVHYFPKKLQSPKLHFYQLLRFVALKHKEFFSHVWQRLHATPSLSLRETPPSLSMLAALPIRRRWFGSLRQGCVVPWLSKLYSSVGSISSRPAIVIIPAIYAKQWEMSFVSSMKTHPCAQTAFHHVNNSIISPRDIVRRYCGRAI